jgi:hypothetical protein
MLVLPGDTRTNEEAGKWMVDITLFCFAFLLLLPSAQKTSTLFALLGTLRYAAALEQNEGMRGKRITCLILLSREWHVKIS